jgi:hypothetical protein
MFVDGNPPDSCGSMTGTGREEKGKKGKVEERKEVIGLFWNFFLTPDNRT